MKLFTIKTILSICLFTIAFSCQQEDEIFMEIEDIQNKNVAERVIETSENIPEWIIDYVTPEEFELWEIMSSKFSINYDFLRDEITDKRKSEVYKIVSEYCKRILNGEESEELSGIFIVATHSQTHQSSDWTSEILTRNEKYTEKKSVTTKIYTSKNHSTIEIYLTVDYTKRNDSIFVDNIKMHNSANSGLNAQVNGSANLDYNYGTGRISGEASGTIGYQYNAGLNNSEIFRTNVSIIP